MNLRAVGRLLGGVLLLMAGFLCLPIAFAAGEDGLASMKAFLGSALISASLGLLLSIGCRGSRSTMLGRPDFFRREGLAVVGLAWIVGGAMGALPYRLSGTLPSFVDAFFESVSGFTTTGSTVLSSEGIDAMAPSIAFWRSFTHWLGGFGIVMVFVLLFPSGGRSLFRSEVAGVSREAAHQRVRDSAFSLMRVYVGMSGVEFGALLLAGMAPFDALLHTFGTIATGGFSNRGQSVLFFHSVPIELVITLFMFLSALNFGHYDTLLRKGPRAFLSGILGSSETKAYVGILACAITLVGVWLWFWGGSNGLEGSELPDYRRFWSAMRDSSFLCVSVSTCTGFGTQDFDRWPELCRLILLLLIAIGACAGSTGGGIKVIRFLILAKVAVNVVLRFIRPRAIYPVRIDGQHLDEETVGAVTSYFGLWALTLAAGMLALSAMGIDIISSGSAVVTCLSNCGPGLGVVGPYLNFAGLPLLAKVLLTILMIVGRLEFYAVVALFMPTFWRHA